MNVKSEILRRWRRAKRLNDTQKNSDVSTKLNRMLVTKDTKEKLNILDECIEILEGKKENKTFIEDSYGEGKEDFLEELNIPENDEITGYQVFYKMSQKVADNEEKENNKQGFESILNLLKSCKIFEIPENINFLLTQTKNRIIKTKLPHYYLFLDTKIVVYDRMYYGIILGDVDQIKEMSKKEKINVDFDSNQEGIVATSFYNGERGVGWNQFNLYDKKVNKYIRKLQEYVMNVICFLNSEDVRIIFKERTERNQERRIKNNKVPLPSYNKIEVVGYLKKYLYKIESEGLGNRFNHRFWVRGHFRHFWNRKYDSLYKKYKKGELKSIEGRQYIMDGSGALKLWIYPYVKGDGLLINQEYKLK